MEKRNWLSKILYIDSSSKLDKMFNIAFISVITVFLLGIGFLIAGFKDIWFLSLVIFWTIIAYINVLIYKKQNAYTFYIWEGNNSNVEKHVLTLTDFLIYKDKIDMTGKSWGSPDLNAVFVDFTNLEKEGENYFNFTFGTTREEDIRTHSDLIFCNIGSWNLPSLMCTYGGKFNGKKSSLLVFNPETKRIEVNKHYKCQAFKIKDPSKKYDPVTLVEIQ